MSRRTNKIALQTRDDNGTAHFIQVVPTIWHLTYKGQLARIRQEYFSGTRGFKYGRSSWTSERSGWNMVHRLRKLYNDPDFGLMEIKG